MGLAHDRALAAQVVEVRVRIRHQGRIGEVVDGVEVGHLVRVPSGASERGAGYGESRTAEPELKVLSTCLAWRTVVVKVTAGCGYDA